EDTAQDPHTTNDRRRPRRERRDRQHAALPQQAATLAIGSQGHAAEAAAVDIRNPVVPGQALIQKGVVRLDQFEHAAILVQHVAEKELGLLAERLTEIFIEVRIETLVR